MEGATIVSRGLSHPDREGPIICVSKDDVYSASGQKSFGWK